MLLLWYIFCPLNRYKFESDSQVSQQKNKVLNKDERKGIHETDD